jgi:hypothetical protein
MKNFINEFDFKRNDLTTVNVESDHQGIWVELLDAKGDTFWTLKSEIENVADGKTNFISDGDNQTHYMSVKKADQLLDEI